MERDRSRFEPSYCEVRDMATGLLESGGVRPSTELWSPAREVHNGRASRCCSVRKSQAPEGQSEDPVGSTRTGAGAYACTGRSTHAADVGHSERVLQESEARKRCFNLQR